ncbi:PIG-L family deacetylase [Williamsia deligens]|uniref:PIG-L family deacetylase n=1 Tax=Williamsia deligens TaxID=321325 RepID=A0ABW3GAH0_9NOCA|nr:PIG-L family deacetylase [Williamsia deligens]MCP2196053.1 N-acetyl-1-D-myo-inositol-2-amino-2-deoxy-alpha-D-glucopyranoside deacetylase [Williamsia deligens]
MSPTSVLFVHAHPDDESLWTGGTIARLVDAGVAVSVITCTWAEGTKRHTELQRALATLGAGPADALGYADGGFPDSAPGADPLCAADVDVAIARIVAHIRRVRPEVLVTYDAYGVYGHPDHVHTNRLALAAIDAAACTPMYPQHGPAWQVDSAYLTTVPVSTMSAIRFRIGSADPDAAPAGTPDDAIDLEVDVTAWVDRKWSAIMEHRSEMDRSTALKALLALDEPTRRRLLRAEFYLRRDLTPGGSPLLPTD